MIQLMFAAALMDTVMVVQEDFDSVIINEWGVITLQEEIRIAATPVDIPFDILFDPESLDDKAPVVYFHGSDFQDAVFTVQLCSGTFTEVYPEPWQEDADGLSITWHITAGYSTGEDYTIPDSLLPRDTPPGDWPIEEWRNRSAHVLELGGLQERFLFYECSIPFDADNPPYPFRNGHGLDPAFQGQVLAFQLNEGREMEMMLCDPGEYSAGSSGMRAYSRDEVIEILCRWSDGELKSEEIFDLWNSWEDYVIDGNWQGDRLLVFRIPPRTIESLTTIRLEIKENPDIITHRFYLGMVPFSWTL